MYNAASAFLLGRSYARSGVRLLFWSSVCFSFLALNNLALVMDLVVLPNSDLRLVRSSLALAAVASLVWGFIWDREGVEP
jgi:hypothetical protein